MREKYEDTFEASMGAEAIQKLLAEIDLDKLSKELREGLSMPTVRSACVCSSVWSAWRASSRATSAPSG